MVLATCEICGKKKQLKPEWNLCKSCFENKLNYELATIIVTGGMDR